MAYRVGRCLLQELLDKAGMSQVDLAVKLNVTKQQINKYCTGATQGMSLEIAKNIAAILRCHIDDLYEWIEVGRNE